MANEKGKNLNKQGFDRADVEANKTIAGLCYLNPILGFLQMKKSKFVRFHINQLLTLLVPVMALMILGVILTMVFSPNPNNMSPEQMMQMASNPSGATGGILVIYLIISILIIPLIIVASMNMLAALKGEAKRIPIFGKITIIPHSNDVKVEDLFEIEALKNIQIGGPTIKCTKCGTKIASGKKFCSSCGTRAPEIVTDKVKCESCGADNLKGFKFCSECGEKPKEVITDDSDKKE